MFTYYIKKDNLGDIMWEDITLVDSPIKNLLDSMGAGAIVSTLTVLGKQDTYRIELHPIQRLINRIASDELDRDDIIERLQDIMRMKETI